MDSIIPYNILTSDLCSKYSSKSLNDLTVEEKDIIYDNAADELIIRARSGEIFFPFHRYYLGNTIDLFNNLKTIDLKINTPYSYRLYSYYPCYNSYLPPKFRGTPTTISGNQTTYESADVLSDHFIEDVRLKSKRYDQQHSILEAWNIDDILKNIMKVALKKGEIKFSTLRDAIYETIPETKIFNPTWARALLKTVIGDNLIGKKWLDISAGWGDRLIAAMSLDMDYLGYDPNINLQEGHSKMIFMFGDSNRHRIIYEQFEQSDIPSDNYDVILSSPPYFTIEEYVPNQVGQSIVTYPDFIQWMVRFLFESLRKGWEKLKIGGYLILHLGDSKTIRMSEATNIFIENNLIGASWEGIIGLKGEGGYARPVWIWKKVIPEISRNIWNPTRRSNYRKVSRISPNNIHHSERTLNNTYPELQAELVRYYATKSN